MGRTRTAYTTWELAVTVVLVLIVVGVVTPLFSRARGRADTAACQTNLKILASAWLRYVNDYDECLPVVWGSDHDLRDRLGPYYSRQGSPACPAARPRGVGYAYNGLLRDDLEPAYPMRIGKLGWGPGSGSQRTPVFWCTGDGSAGAPIVDPSEAGPQTHRSWRARHQRQWAVAFPDLHVALLGQQWFDRRVHPECWSWEPATHPVSYGARIVRSEGGSFGGRAMAPCDGNGLTEWKLDAGVDMGWVELELPALRSFERIVISNDAYQAAFELLAPTDMGWREIYRFAGREPQSRIGALSATFPTVTTRRVRLRLHRVRREWPELTEGDRLEDIDLW